MPEIPEHAGELRPAAARMAEVAWRAAEMLIAGLALILTAPVMLAIAVIIRLDSPGPALFRQTRIGRGLRPFTFYKFRTLWVNARELYPELYSYQYSLDEIDSLQFKKADDPRITRIGAWLRKSTLDELPNFWNVLKGDMALVGPRPEIPEMLRYYTAEEMVKFSVSPGIVGLAQINGRGRLLFRQTNAFDVHYAKTRSLQGDLKIVLRTIWLIVTRDGAF